MTGDGEREAVVVREGEEEDMAEEGRGREGEERREVQEINDYGVKHGWSIFSFPHAFAFGSTMLSVKLTAQKRRLTTVPALPCSSVFASETLTSHSSPLTICLLACFPG